MQRFPHHSCGGGEGDKRVNAYAEGHHMRGKWCLPLLLQVWRANDMGGWDEEQALHGHKDWVRDAAWAPNLGMPLSTIASAGQDGQVG